ncbi:MAG TPA: DUF1223 domain-containing protein [Rhizobiaceae bacterium]|nr:DUF1223 domain-containing protein [Rhizobiaceae bacterium]
MLKVLRAVACAALALLALPAAAGENAPVPIGVVELFTSQGCNSCPPADAALQKLAQRSDVVALSWHVDYWDYLGWKDTLASPANTKRQYGYARTLKRSNVYTPQAVLNGIDHINGGDLDGIVTRLHQFAVDGKGLNVPLQFTDKGDRLHLTIPATDRPDDATVLLVYFAPRQETQIERGENAGKTIAYVNSVLDFMPVGMWKGEELTIDLPVSGMTDRGAGGCAVLLQRQAADGTPGEIIGAAILVDLSG